MSWVGVTNTPTLTMSVFSTLKVFGSMTLVAGMNTNLVSPISFESTTPGQTITTAGKALTFVTFNGIGGEWTLQDNFKATAVIELHNGILNSNNQAVQTEQFRIFTGFALNMGASIYTITYKWEVFGPCTVNAGTSTINMNSGGGTPVSFYGGGRTYNNVNFTTTTETALINDDNNTFTGNVTFFGGGWVETSNTFNILTLSPGRTYTFKSGRTQTINGTIAATGLCTSFINIVSSVTGSSTTFSKTSGSITVSYVSLKDITATGGASFTANNSIDLGNNNGWTFGSSISKNLYWIGNSGNWNDGNHWSLSSGGPAYGCIPTAADNVFFDANSF